MKKKILPLLAAALVLSLSACSDTAQTSGPGAETSREETRAEDREEPGGEGAGGGGGSAQQTGGAFGEEQYGSWDSIPYDTVIAYVEGDPGMNITFGEFYREYAYYLLSTGIDDDMSEENLESCRGYRENFMTYLQFEKVFLRLAEEKGFGVSALTAEDNEAIRQKADEARENFLATYFYEASEALGADASEADIRAFEEKRLKEDFEQTNLPDDIFTTWERNDLIQNKLLTDAVKDMNVPEERIDDMFSEYVEAAKEAAENDPYSYESNASLNSVYIPEGTRLADQILLMFDSDTKDAVSSARRDGNDEEADRLRSEAYESRLKERAQELISQLEAGADFYELRDAYNEDPGKTSTYVVIPNSAMYVKEFTEAVYSVEKAGGFSAPAVSDYGVHIIFYPGDKVLTDEDIEAVRGEMRSYLEYQELLNIQESAYEGWMAQFPYKVNYKLLRLNEPESGN